MKKLLLILCLLITCSAHAERATGRLTIIENDTRSRYACYPFTVYFRTWKCKTKYCSYVRYPSTIRGNACGVYVSCRKVSGNLYSCRY